MYIAAHDDTSTRHALHQRGCIRKCCHPQSTTASAAEGVLFHPLAMWTMSGTSIEQVDGTRALNLGQATHIDL